MKVFGKLKNVCKYKIRNYKCYKRMCSDLDNTQSGYKRSDLACQQGLCPELDITIMTDKQKLPKYVNYREVPILNVDNINECEFNAIKLNKNNNIICYLYICNQYILPSFKMVDIRLYDCCQEFKQNLINLIEHYKEEREIHQESYENIFKIRKNFNNIVSSLANILTKDGTLVPIYRQLLSIEEQNNIELSFINFEYMLTMIIYSNEKLFSKILQD